jgi:hypothetical protein
VVCWSTRCHDRAAFLLARSFWSQWHKRSYADRFDVAKVTTHTPALTSAAHTNARCAVAKVAVGTALIRSLSQGAVAR